MATHSQLPARGVAQKIIAVLLVAVGAVLVGTTFTNNLYKVGPAFESLTKDFRPIMTQQSIDTAHRDIAGLAAVDTEFKQKVGPGIAQQLKMTPEQFNAYVGTNFPSVAKGTQALGQITTSFDGLVTTLDEQRALFRSADAIPTKDLPATTVPWGLLIAGILTMAAGVLVWFRPRAGAVMAIVLGLLLVVGPFVMSLPGKASDADQLNKNLTPVYTQQLTEQATTSVATVGAMGTEMQAKMLPALATALKMDQGQTAAFLAQNFPATAAAMVSLPTALPRFQNLVLTFDNQLGHFNTLKPVKFVPIVWTMIFAGIAALLLGLWGLFAGAVRRPVAVSVPGPRKDTTDVSGVTPQTPTTIE